MPVIQDLNAMIAAGGPMLSDGKSKEEFGDAITKGLFLEVRASEKSVPTWYLRLKGPKGNIYKRLGTLREVTLPQARKLTKQIRAEHAVAVMSGTLEKGLADKHEMTLDEFMRDHYFPHAFLHKRSAKKDEQLYRIHIGPRFKDTPLSQITRRDVQAFHNELLKKGQSPASADHSLKLLKRCANLCCQWEFLDRHVLKGVPLFSVSNMVTTYLQEHDVTRLVEVLRKDSNRPVCNLLSFLICVGLRRMTGQLLRWSELDLENRVLNIPAAKSKSKRPVSIPLNDSAMHVLQQVDTKGKYEYVFVNPKTGKPYTTITRVWYRLRKKAGLSDNVRMHDLRHYFASALSLAGVPAQEISLLMTHADSRSVQRYLHVSMPRLQQSANRVSILTQPQVTTMMQISDAANAGSVIEPRSEIQPAKAA